MAHPADVKLYLEASTKIGLINKMVDNNRFHATAFVYGSPIKEDGNWIVWFTANIQSYRLKELNRPKPVVEPKKPAKKKVKK